MNNEFDQILTRDDFWQHISPISSVEFWVCQKGEKSEQGWARPIPSFGASCGLRCPCVDGPQRPQLVDGEHGCVSVYVWMRVRVWIGGSPKKKKQMMMMMIYRHFPLKKTCSEPHPPLSPPPVPQCLPALRLLVAAHHHLAGWQVSSAQ